MRKKLFGTIVVIFTMFAGYSVYETQNENDIVGTVLANVEALADNENKPRCATDETYTHFCNYSDSAHPCPCGF